MEKVYIIMSDEGDYWGIHIVFKNKKDADDWIINKTIELYEDLPERWNKIIEENGKYAKSNRESMIKDFKFGFIPYEIQEYPLF